MKDFLKKFLMNCTKLFDAFFLVYQGVCFFHYGFYVFCGDFTKYSLNTIPATINVNPMYVVITIGS